MPALHQEDNSILRQANGRKAFEQLPSAPPPPLLLPPPTCVCCCFFFLVFSECLPNRTRSFSANTLFAYNALTCLFLLCLAVFPVFTEICEKGNGRQLRRSIGRPSPCSLSSQAHTALSGRGTHAEPSIHTWLVIETKSALHTEKNRYKHTYIREGMPSHVCGRSSNDCL